MNFSALIPPQDVSSLCVGLGILIGLIWTRRTGWGCGGLITPGLLALYAGEPWRAAAAVAFGALLAPALALISSRFHLYGRERLGAAMLLALGVRMLLPLLSLPVDSHWVGWVVPGLVAAEANRQGLGMTVCSTVACAVATAFTFGLLQTYMGAAL